MSCCSRAPREATQTTDYRFAHFKLRSELKLPYLCEWGGTDERPPDFDIALGEVGPLADPVALSPRIFVDGKGSLLFRSKMPFIIGVRGGRHMTVQVLRPDISPLMHIRVLTIPLGFVCYQLGSPPLHGGLVEIGGKVVALCAPSGAGKSTLVATLLARGHPVLSDDLCITRQSGDGGLIAYSGVGTLKLLPQSVAALGLDRAALAPEGGISGKLVLSMRDLMVTGGRRLRAILHLQPGAEKLAVTRVPAAEAMQYMADIYYRPYLAHGLPPKLLYGHFMATLRAAPLHLLQRPDDLARVHDVAAAVEDFVTTLA